VCSALEKGGSRNGASPNGAKATRPLAKGKKKAAARR
jgi:hypothetical protein